MSFNVIMWVIIATYVKYAKSNQMINFNIKIFLCEEFPRTEPFTNLFYFPVRIMLLNSKVRSKLKIFFDHHLIQFFHILID